MSNDGLFHSQASRTRPASDGMVFTAERREWDHLSMHGKQILRLVKNLLLSWQFFNMSQKCGGHGISKRWFCYNTRNPFRDKSLTQISQTASLGASNFLIVHDQYSETTVAVCYYFCVFDNSSVSRGQSRPKVIRPLYLFPKPSATSWTPFYRKNLPI